MSKHEDVVPIVCGRCGYIRCIVDWVEIDGAWWCKVSMGLFGGQDPQIVYYTEPTAAWRHLTDGITAALADAQTVSQRSEGSNDDQSR